MDTAGPVETVDRTVEVEGFRVMIELIVRLADDVLLIGGPSGIRLKLVFFAVS